MLKKREMVKKKNNKTNKQKAEVIFDASAFEIKIAGVSNKKMMELRQRLEQESSDRNIKKNPILFGQKQRVLYFKISHSGFVLS